jgi:hypothetical protein
LLSVATTRRTACHARIAIQMINALFRNYAFIAGFLQEVLQGKIEM